MDCVGEHLLAAATLAQQKNWDLAQRCPLSPSDRKSERLAVADDLLEALYPS